MIIRKKISDDDYNKILNLFKSKYMAPYSRGKCDMVQFLETKTKELKNDILCLELSNNLKSLIKLFIKDYDSLCKNLIEIINLKRHQQEIQCYRLLEAEFKKFIDNKWISIVELPPNLALFRMRVVEDNIKNTDTLHVPFCKRECISTQRFSIEGNPLLYLGSSPYICWEELKRPSKSNLYVSRFRNIKPLKVIGFEEILPNMFSLLDKEKITYDFIIRIFMFLPFVLAMFMKVENPNEKFIPEYIFPNLLMSLVNEYQDIDGITYLSTQLNKNTTSPFLCKNIVLKCPDDGNPYSIRTLNKFKITKPYCFGDLKFPMQVRNNKSRDKFSLSLDNGNIIKYTDSDFYFLEYKLHLLEEKNILISSDDILAN